MNSAHEQPLLCAVTKSREFLQISPGLEVKQAEEKGEIAGFGGKYRSHEGDHEGHRTVGVGVFIQPSLQCHGVKRVSLRMCPGTLRVDRIGQRCQTIDQLREV